MVKPVLSMIARRGPQTSGTRRLDSNVPAMGGGGDVIRYQILDPLKIKYQISDPPKNQISFITASQKNQISDLKNHISDPLYSFNVANL